MKEERVKLAIQALLSLGLVASGLFILTSISLQDKPEVTAAATGWIGLVVGYWLK